jgi:SAM-dependent methyltransferase
MQLGILEFVINNTEPSDFNGKRILEVGSRYVNGSVRPYIFKLSRPESYVGVDIEEGKFVDVVLDAEKLVDHFGENSFDVVISCETVEHVENWRLVFENIKRVLKPNGLLILTTVTPGFHLHGYPNDYWRYERGDMNEIFSDFHALVVATDPETHGIYVKALKPEVWQPNDLSMIQLYSMDHEKELSKEFHVISIRVRERYLRIVRPLYRFLFPRDKKRQASLT